MRDRLQLEISVGSGEERPKQNERTQQLEQSRQIEQHHETPHSKVQLPIFFQSNAPGPRPSALLSRLYRLDPLPRQREAGIDQIEACRTKSKDTGRIVQENWFYGPDERGEPKILAYSVYTKDGGVTVREIFDLRQSPDAEFEAILAGRLKKLKSQDR